MEPESIQRRLLLCQVETRLLTYAAEIAETRAALDAASAGLVDEAAAVRRAAVLLGLAEFRLDDVRILLPRSRIGRALWRVGRLLLRAARAVG